MAIAGACALLVSMAVPSLIVKVVAGTAYIAAAPYVGAYVAVMVLLSMANVVAMYNVGISRISHSSTLSRLSHLSMLLGSLSFTIPWEGLLGFTHAQRASSC